MQIIKLDATDSTNAHLRRLLSAKALEDYTVVMARKQTKGRGQMSAKWGSEPGKNLTVSILRSNLSWPVNQSFFMNICVSLAMFNVLLRLRVPDLSIKWPNDILSGTSKLGGILIENKISGTVIRSSIIGIGLNVNQIAFGKELRKASSLQLVMGRSFELDGIVHKIVRNLQAIFDQLNADGPEVLWNAYEKRLFRRGMLSTFENGQGELFQGVIKGVTYGGKLMVAFEDDTSKEFDLKELKLLY